jgi:large subunit ribosomal protein LP0
MATRKTAARKEHLAHELEGLFSEYSTFFLATLDNVGSNQLHEIRKALRGQAIIYCGKNTQIRRVLRKLEEEGRHDLEQIRLKFRSNLALVFTSKDLAEVRNLLEAHKMPSAAKAGAIAQCDLILPRGITQLEPSQTPLLQALDIPTKVSKGTLEVLKDVHILKAGDKVDASQAALLQKMDLKPFSFGLQVKHVYDRGSLYHPDVLSIQNTEVIKVFQVGIQNVAAASLAMGMPTAVSVPYSILLAFRNLLSVSAATEFEFKESSQVKSYLEDPSAFVWAEPAPASPASDTAPPTAPPADDSDLEEEIGVPTDLWGDGDDY